MPKLPVQSQTASATGGWAAAGAADPAGLRGDRFRVETLLTGSLPWR